MENQLAQIKAHATSLHSQGDYQALAALAQALQQLASDVEDLQIEVEPEPDFDNLDF